MYKVCFVDDELINHTLLERLVDWKEMGFVVAGTATDGDEAIALVRRVEPDLLFMDIKMPSMDGITCIAEIRKEYPTMQIVLVTAFSEFSYAQKAITYQVAHYLLKPVSRVQMQKIVEEMKQKLDQQYKQQSSTDLQEEHQQQRMQLQLQQVLQLLSTNHVPTEQDCTELLRQPMMVLDLFLFDSFGRACDFEDRENVVSVIKQWFKQLEVDIYAVVPVTQNRLVVFTQIIAEKEMLLSAIATIQQQVALQIDCYYFDHAMHTANWRSYLEKLAGKERVGFYQRQGGIYKYHNQTLFSKANSIEESVGEVIIKAFETLTRAPIAEYLAKKFSWASEDFTRPSLVIDFCINLLVSIKISLKSFFSFDTALLLREVHLQEMQKIEKLQQLQYTMDRHLYDLFEELNRQVQALSKGQTLVAKANMLAQKNFQRSGFSLQEVADEVHLSKNYFVTSYKEEAGIGFWDYVTNLRMERAKHLLLSTNDTNAVISQSVGYESEYHFVRKFKSLVGKTPNQFRKGK